MVDFIGAVRDPQFRQDVGQGLVDAAGRGLAMIGGAPVDLTTMFLRPLGYSMPDEQIIGSSEYLGRQMADMGLISQARNPVAEFLSALLIPDPTDIQKLAPVIERAITKGAQNLAAPRTLSRQAGQIGVAPTPRPQAPREEALRIAQENAAKPVSEGGLGLPPDNTAMDRARAMGYTQEGYHGTNFDVPAFDLDRVGSSTVLPYDAPRGFYFAKDPLVAGRYSRKSADNANIIPVLLNKDGEMFNNSKMIVNSNPSSIRSRFAAFDPARRYESDLLGAADPRLLMLLGLGSGAGLYGLGELYRQEQDNR